MPAGLISGDEMNTNSDSEPPGTTYTTAVSTLNKPHTGSTIARRRRLRPSGTHTQIPKRLKAVPIVVLYNQSQPLRRGEPIDILSDEETAWVAGKVAHALKRYAPEVQLVPVQDELKQELAGLDPNRHLIFNLCESLGGRSFSEVEAAEEIAKRGFVFTGAAPETMRLTMDKINAKRLLIKHGLPTPAYQVVEKLNGRTLRVPLPAIVKPSVESGSMGITQDSLAHTPGKVWERVEFCLRSYRQPVLLETYIPGREINVAIWGAENPEILPLYEIDFQWTADPYQRIVSFDSKWVADSIEYHGTPGICPAKLSKRDAHRVRSVALRAYQLLGIRSYARIDIRLHQGIPYILEINTNPDLAPNAGFYKTAKAAGFSYPQMVRKIAQLALDSQP